MAELYSQYTSGTQFTAGAIAGSVLGTSGINPMVDRLNKAFPEAFEYEWQDNSPSFQGDTYVSDDIFLNQNLSGCRVKGSYLASGTGSMTWGLYKVQTFGDAVNGSYIGSMPIGDVYGVSYNNDTTNIGWAGNDLSRFYIVSGPSQGTPLGSVFVGNYLGGCCYDQVHNNFLVQQYTGGPHIIHQISGNSTTPTKLGSFVLEHIPGIGSQDYLMDLAWDTLNSNMLMIPNINATTRLYVFSGAGGTLHPDFGSILLPGNNWGGIGWDEDQDNLLGVNTGNDFVYVFSGLSNTILGSFALTQTIDSYGGLSYINNGSIIVGDRGTDKVYYYDLGMETETLVSGLPYNELKTLSANLDIGSYPKVRLKVNRSQSANKLHSLRFDYL